MWLYKLNDSGTTCRIRDGCPKTHWIRVSDPCWIHCAPILVQLLYHKTLTSENAYAKWLEMEETCQRGLRGWAILDSLDMGVRWRFDTPFKYAKPFAEARQSLELEDLNAETDSYFTWKKRTIIMGLWNISDCIFEQIYQIRRSQRSLFEIGIDRRPPIPISQIPLSPSQMVFFAYHIVFF